MDKDLQFLTEMSNEELTLFIKILTQDKNEETIWTEELTSLQVYKDNYPNHHMYIKEAIHEFQKFGGDTIANLFRGGRGVSYDEILCDVCKVLKVGIGKNDDVLSRECALLKKYFEDTLEKLPKEEVEKIARSLGIDFSQMKDMVISKIIDLIFLHGNKIFLGGMGASAGIGVGAVAGQIFGRLFGTSIGGPVTWGISIVSLLPLLSSPATRITIPATLYIAYLRQIYFQKKEEKERNESFNDLETILKDVEISEEERVKILKDFDIEKILKKQKLNILIVGGTGVGKSSTINALFDEEKASVGRGSTPETMDVCLHDFGNFVIYDSPGLGDSPEKDELHKQKIRSILLEKNEHNEALIDLVLVIIDGRTRDLSSFGNLIEVIKPLLEDKRRILVAINKCDQVGNDPTAFDYQLNQPSEYLLCELKECVKAVQSRVAEYGVDADIVYYSAGLTRMDGTRQRPYNLSKLLYHILKNTPKKKRFIYIQHQAKKQENFQSNEAGGRNYNQENFNEAKESVFENIKVRLGKFGDAIVEKVEPVVAEVAEKFAKKMLEKFKWF